MKFIQDFSNPDGPEPHGYRAMKAIENMPLPYTGNKKKLLPKIDAAIKKHNVKFDSVLDAFTGSATVALWFKMMGKRVIANDLLTSSYLNAVAFVENPGIKLSDEEKEFLLRNENKSKGTFVEDNYLGTQFRTDGKKSRFNKFTLKECRQLDNFRANIDELCDPYRQGLGMAANAAVIMRLPFGNVDLSHDIMNHRVKQKEAYGKESDKHDRRIGIYYDEELNLNFDKWFKKYVDDFACSGNLVQDDVNDLKIKRASFLVNLQQHVLRDCFVGGRMNCGQVLAEVEERLKHQKNQLKASSGNGLSTEMDFITDSGQPGQGMKWWNFADTNFGTGKCLATNMDAIDLLKSGLEVDCCYYDPPYGGSASEYSTMYRFLEEYIYSAELEDLPHIVQHGAKFAKKKNYEENFLQLLDAARHISTWMFSYNDSSWKSIEYIVDLIRQFKSDVVVETLTDKYRYLYRKRQGRENKSCEYLIIAR